MVIAMIVGIQIAIAGVVVFVLKCLLDRELKEVALEKFERATMADAKEIVVRYGASLSDMHKSRFVAVHKRKFSAVPLRFEHKGELMGGVVIVLGKEELDFSVVGRLRNFWS